MVGKDPNRPRNLRLEGRRTSVRLEDPFWDALNEIAVRSGRPTEAICAAIAAARHRGNLSSAIRVFVLDWFRRHGQAAATAAPRRNVPQRLRKSVSNAATAPERAVRRLRLRR